MMVVKSIKANATHAATKRIEEVIDQHRIYFSDWRSDKFGRNQSPIAATSSAKKETDKNTTK